jgi:hypothetical protein
LNGWDAGKAGKGGGPAPIPQHLGDPSPIKHVVYIIREDRTYDQILGDAGRGNSDPALVNFGRDVTPNAHALATEFALLDNFYVSGRRSNDGHQWAIGGQNPDYFQKANGNDQRSELNAPSSGFDALLYTPSGFLWENALRNGKTFDDYSEYTKEDVAPPAYSDIPSLDAHVVREFPGFQLQYPDQLRARVRVAPGGLRGGEVDAGPDPADAAERPYGRQRPAVSDGAVAGGRQRRRAGPDRGRDQPFVVLAEHGDLRCGGRRPERRGPRRRPPQPRVRHQPVRPAQRGGQHVRHAGEHGPDDRADSGAAADEPPRCRGSAHALAIRRSRT